MARGWRGVVDRTDRPRRDGAATVGTARERDGVEPTASRAVHGGVGPIPREIVGVDPHEWRPARTSARGIEHSTRQHARGWPSQRIHRGRHGRVRDPLPRRIFGERGRKGDPSIFAAGGGRIGGVLFVVGIAVCAADGGHHVREGGYFVPHVADRPEGQEVDGGKDEKGIGAREPVGIGPGDERGRISRDCHWHQPKVHANIDRVRPQRRRSRSRRQVMGRREWKVGHCRRAGRPHVARRRVDIRPRDDGADGSHRGEEAAIPGVEHGLASIFGIRIGMGGASDDVVEAQAGAVRGRRRRGTIRSMGAFADDGRGAA
ncbi:hypothetical protein BU24DRAFT_477695, partial [Aaosphaeria arxii CBS 175.79]